MGKGSQKTTTSTKAQPWGPIGGYLKGGFQDLNSLYKQGAPGYFPGQTVADQSSWTQGAYGRMADRATNGSPLMGSANNTLMKTLNGDYLDPNSNPAFQGALSAAIRPITDAFSKEVMPGIDSSFSAAGRYGSGAQMGAYGDAQTNLGRSIGDVSSNMAMGLYNNERGNQMTALGMAPDMANQDYKDISMLGLAGQGMDTYNQQLIDAEKAKYDYNANKDLSWLQNYIGLLGGAPQAGVTSTTKVPAPSLWQQIGGYVLNNAGQAAKVFGGGM